MSQLSPHRLLPAAVVVVGLLSAVALSLPLLSGQASAAPTASANGAGLFRESLLDGRGKKTSLASVSAQKGLVVLFLAPTCPMSNSYAEPLAELAKRFPQPDFGFVGIYSDAKLPPAEMEKHAREHALGFPVLLDRTHALARRLSATVTPEAFVVKPGSGEVLYSGRIDDAYVSRLQRRATVTKRDLAEALLALKEGKSVAATRTPAFGCSLNLPPAPKSAARISYYRDIAPILQENCEGCHRPGQVAPFSLTSYDDARSWASEIKSFTANRQMPPWRPEQGHGEFEGVRRLSETQIARLAEWADAGAPAGNPKDGPKTKVWSDEWALGKPDLILEVPEAHTIAAAGDDEFRVFVLPTELTEDKHVTAIDFRPGNNRVVHHFVSFVDPSGRGRQLDEAQPGPGYESGPGGVKVPAATIQGVWAPGNLPRFLPEGVGRPLPKGSDILLQVHYHRTGKQETDRSRVGLYFSKKPIERVAQTMIVGPFNIDIPPDAPRHMQTLKFKLPFEFELLTVMPHMHLLGREMKVFATLPDGKREELVWIKDWDYRWQESYRYRTPVKLPPGSELEVTAYFDNTTANPLNPSSPPRRVRFGEQTTDEMAFAIFEAIMPRGGGFRRGGGGER